MTEDQFKKLYKVLESIESTLKLIGWLLFLVVMLVASVIYYM